MMDSTVHLNFFLLIMHKLENLLHHFSQSVYAIPGLLSSPSLREKRQRAMGTSLQET